MPVTHVNRKRDTYYLHAGTTKAGKPRYWFSKSAEGQLVGSIPEVARRVPALRVLLVGDGPERSRLEARARALGVEARLAIAGAREDVVPYLAAADLLAAPSRNEGMGRALVEALALGVPVVGTRVGGIPSVLGGGRYGPLVPPDDPAALAQALIELLEDPARRATLGRAGPARAAEFTVEVMTTRIADVYRSLARG